MSPLLLVATPAAHDSGAENAKSRCAPAPLIQNSLSINPAMAAKVHWKGTQRAVVNVANNPDIAPVSGVASRVIPVSAKAAPALQWGLCGYFCGYHEYQFKRELLRIKSMCLISGGEGGIRTRGGYNPSHAFQACDLNRSSTSPMALF